MFLIHDGYGIGFNVLFLLIPIHSGYFDNRDTREKVSKVFICVVSRSVFTAYLHSSRGDVCKEECFIL